MEQEKPLNTVWRRIPVLAGLPEGALQVGCGLIVSGLSAYGFLVLSARALGPERYASLSALWAIVALIGPGLFLPLEQEVSRAIAARRASGSGSRPVVTRAFLAGSLFLVVVLVLMLPWWSFLKNRLFDGQTEIVIAFASSLIGYFLIHMARGALSGRGSFKRYSLLLGTEGLTRLGLCFILFLAGVDSVGWYAAVFAVAPFIAAGVSYLGVPPLKQGPEAAWKELSTSLGYLVAASLLAQVLVNFGPLAVKALAAPSERAAASHFLAGLVVARVPLFLFAAIYTTLLPKLAGLAAMGRMDEFRKGVTRVAVVVAAIGLLATSGAFLLGPPIVRLLFGKGFDLGRTDLTYLAAGSSFYMLGLAFSQALIALAGHARVALGWMVSVVVLLVVTASRTGLLARVEQGFLAGSVAAVIAMTILLFGAMKSARLHPVPGHVAAADAPIEP